jgi:hypothetical protein
MLRTFTPTLVTAGEKPALCHSMSVSKSHCSGHRRSDGSLGSRAPFSRCPQRVRSTSDCGTIAAAQRTDVEGQKQPYGLAPFRSAAVLIQVRKDKGLNRPARYCNSRSGLTIRSGDNSTSTVAATRIGRMGGWVRLSNHRSSAQPADPVDHVTG